MLRGLAGGVAGTASRIKDAVLEPAFYPTKASQDALFRWLCGAGEGLQRRDHLSNSTQNWDNFSSRTIFSLGIEV